MQTSVNTLKELMKLAKSKDKLESQLAKINADMAALLSQLTPGAVIASPAKKIVTEPQKTSAPKGKRKRRGDLTTKIVEALKDAGPAGLKVPAIAAKVGAKGTNVHAWLASTGKDRTERVGRGCYRLKPQGQSAQHQPQQP